MAANPTINRLPSFRFDTGFLSELQNYVSSHWDFISHRSFGSKLFGLFNSTIDGTLASYKSCKEVIHNYLNLRGAPFLLAVGFGVVSVGLYVRSAYGTRPRRDMNARRRKKISNGDVDAQNSFRRQGFSVGDGEDNPKSNGKLLRK